MILRDYPLISWFPNGKVYIEGNQFLEGGQMVKIYKTILIKEVIGEDVMPLVKLIDNSKEWSEFELASKLKKEVNEIRNLLYKLHKHNLVGFKKKKDEEKGWYVYYWFFNRKGLGHVVKDANTQKLKKLVDRLEREKQNQFFICKDLCIRLDFEQAMTSNFSCPECGDVLHQEDNSGKIKDIEKEIFVLKDIKD